MITIRCERPADVPAREILLDLAFGPGRWEKTSQRLRTGNAPAPGLALVACERDRVVGTIRLWPVLAGDRPALLLGPLAVHPAEQNRGIGASLLRHALAEAARRGHHAVLLVGDAPYYERFGFSAALTPSLAMPGPYEPERLLARELVAGALAAAGGLITAAAKPQVTVRRVRRRAIGQSRRMMPRAA